ncbi:hypothetical protein AYO20_10619 [Fonsecaea nubica]|uniref:Uncharacterized protein n=1 Tax=Fonsecaea nubica TaxID=856822 RepID=A0A178C667_9EURO|nr:hypothetical protein AYO20_10619 [Fonsecaea nubica]OAL24914.1 hypothetical protein AYO20_10619 [Fonsecaea nubica]
MSKAAMEPSTQHSKNPLEDRDVASQTYLSLPQSNSDPAKIKAPLIQSIRYSPYPKPTFIAAVRQKASGALKQALQWHQTRIQNWLSPKQSTQESTDVDSETTTVENDSLSSIPGSDAELTTPEIDQQTQVSENSEYLSVGDVEVSTLPSEDLMTSCSTDFGQRNEAYQPPLQSLQASDQSSGVSIKAQTPEYRHRITHDQHSPLHTQQQKFNDTSRFV